MHIFKSSEIPQHIIYIAQKIKNHKFKCNYGKLRPKKWPISVSCVGDYWIYFITGNFNKLYLGQLHLKLPKILSKEHNTIQTFFYSVDVTKMLSTKFFNDMEFNTATPGLPLFNLFQDIQTGKLWKQSQKRQKVFLKKKRFFFSFENR